MIGISAKNGNKSDQDIAEATKAQLEQQLGTTASEVQGGQQAQATRRPSDGRASTSSCRRSDTSVDAIQNSINT